MSNSQHFRYNSPFDRKASVNRLTFSSDKPLLEVELNEMQDVQNSNLKSLAHMLVPSGFVELKAKDFTGEDIIYNPSDGLYDKLNHIAIAPAKAIVNGMEINITGNFSYDGYDTYTLINLGEAPKTGMREDLVYLEVWMEKMSCEETFTDSGYIKGNTLDYRIMDSRVNEETSRRICVRYDIRVAKNIDFFTFPDGLGYKTINSFSNVQAACGGKLGYDYNSRLVFRSAADDIFKNCEFYKDYNLYVAGRKDYTLKNDNIVGQFIFAIPMFRIKRRNQSPYSISNFNGSRSSHFSYEDFTSATYGDLANHIRPDKLYYDLIDEKDIVDLRYSTALGTLSPLFYLNKGMQEVFSGKLKTKDNICTRRVQFGRETIDYKDNQYVIFAATYNDKTIYPYIGSSTAAQVLGKQPKYRNSVSGYGIAIDGTAQIRYTLSNLTADNGTIDFFMQPYWNGYDDTIQTLVTVFDKNNNPFIRLRKYKNQLRLNQYSTEATTSLVQAIADLNDNLIFAKQIYHIRISWTNNAQVTKMFIYLNGNVIAQATYMGSTLSPKYLAIGSDNEPGPGFVLEEIIIYNHSYEQNVNNGVYSYVSNTFWPSIPNDFMANRALIHPSFNSLYKNFADNTVVQDNTLTIISKINEAFTLNAPYNIKIVGTPKVYLMEGDVDVNNHIIEAEGTLTKSNGNWIFSPVNEGYDKVIFQYSIELPNGEGSGDLPNKMLAAGLVDTDDILQECSFARKGSTKARTVEYANPSMVSAAVDTAYDYSTKRSNRQCYARQLFYHKSGDGTNHYEIPYRLYGYEVIGIMNATNREITRIVRYTPSEEDSDGHYEITLKNNVAYGDVVEFQIALGGWTFDYETHTKTLVSNLHKTKMVQVKCDGLRNEFTVPCYETNGNGGVVKSVFNFIKNNIDESTGKVVDKENLFACYVDDEMFPLLQDRNSSGSLIDRYSHQLAVMQIDDTSFGTPFLRIKLNFTPAEGTILTIPVLISYQPTQDEILSVWYEYMPYQGILSKTHKSLKRISDWKYFETTLSSGHLTLNVDEDNYYSYNNVINRLPGGNSFASLITGQPINFKSDIQEYGISNAKQHTGDYTYHKDEKEEIDPDDPTPAPDPTPVIPDDYNFNGYGVESSPGIYDDLGNSLLDGKGEPLIMASESRKIDVVDGHFGVMEINDNTILDMDANPLMLVEPTDASEAGVYDVNNNLLIDLDDIIVASTRASDIPDVINTSEDDEESAAKTDYTIIEKDSYGKSSSGDVYNTKSGDTKIKDKSDANLELRFLSNVVFASSNNIFDDAFFELDSEFDLYRATSGFQDEKLQGSLKKFKAYFNDTIKEISNYTGMSALVVDEHGNILLLIVGALNTDASKLNILQPTYGDLFKLTNRPIIVPIK